MRKEYRLKEMDLKKAPKLKKPVKEVTVEEAGDLIWTAVLKHNIDRRVALAAMAGLIGMWLQLEDAE